jgi:uncharacterized protein YbjT (DUF2867 family)
MTKIITILGATGNVGSKTVKHLLGKGHTLRLIARGAEKLSAFKNESGVEIHSGTATDSDFLARVMKGSDVVFLMMPADFTAVNIGAYQDKLGLAIIDAIKKSGVKKVLNLSSVGGHTEEKTGIVAGLARQEKRLNELTDVDVLHLRPSYFMENLLGNIPIIKNMQVNGSPIAADRAFPIIATADVARAAAEQLTSATWSGKSVQPLLGPKDYTMNEVTSVLSNAIGQPNLPYVQFPFDQAKQGMMQMGLNESFADAYIGLSDGINHGVFNLEKRDNTSTTPTTIEEFAANTFKPVYHSN